ncbi:MAG: HpcH/HpaI aldolase/citrate lyase family protein [Pseudomonadota bacterium]
MPAPINPFKKAILEGQTIFGCWNSLGTPMVSELLGTAGFDWVLIDGEHAPYDIATIRNQLIALENSDSAAVVRVPIGETWIIKQVLDCGVQTILVPIVESAAQAKQLVGACRYPPVGERGVGYSLARASCYGEITDYGTSADDQICLLVQVENRAGMEALDDILAVEGVDGVFIGPADLSADYGHMGDIMHPEVQEMIMGALGRIKAAGKAPGILSTREDMTEASLEAGAQFLAVGLDIGMLAQAARATAKRWKSSGA